VPKRSLSGLPSLFAAQPRRPTCSPNRLLPQPTAFSLMLAGASKCLSWLRLPWLFTGSGPCFRRRVPSKPGVPKQARLWLLGMEARSWLAGAGKGGHPAQ
jgi:hypothetical protein